MGAEAFLKRLSHEEQIEVAQALPEDIVRAEALRREMGALSLDSHDLWLQTNASAFLDPEKEVHPDIQYAVMQRLWRKLDHKMPDIPQEQWAKTKKILTENPSYRIYPAPFLTLEGRRLLVERGRQLPGQKMNFRGPALTVYTGSRALFDGTNYDHESKKWMYPKLLAMPEAIISEGRQDYGLRYAVGFDSATGYELATREDYIASLKNDGAAVESKHDGTTWIFPIADVGGTVEHPNLVQRGHFLDNLAPTNTPEVHLADQLLRQVNGAPFYTEPHVGLCNEVICELDETGEPSTIKFLAGVMPRHRGITLSAFPV